MTTYFNIHGGSPGRAPAMNHHFHAPGGLVPMDRLLVASKSNLRAHNDNRKTISIGKDNPVQATLSELRNLKSLISAAGQILAAEEVAVYVIAAERPSCVKIGKARSPLHRLATLQTGNPETLFVHRAFFFRDAATATRVEERAHWLAGDSHYRLEGEWFECIPYQAHNHIRQAADEMMLDYCAFNPTAEGIHNAA